MLGLTLECARCHDHKFDPITQRDYYSLFAFFNSIDESGLYSHFTNATPSPSLLLWSPPQQREHERLTARITATEVQLARLAGEAREAFQAAAHPPPLTLPRPVAHLPFSAAHGASTPDLVLPRSALLEDGPVIVREPRAGGGSISAIRFSGDNAVVHPAVRSFTRTDAFSLALRLKVTERQERAVLVHQSRAWTDAGSRGFELTLDRGRPFFGLVHFWPGNAIAVRARQALPLGAWTRLVVTYDGSSRAAGIRLYLDGAPLEVDVIRDRLYKDIDYRRSAGDGYAKPASLTLGARFRDSGFKNGSIDDLQVFALALTPAEIAAAAGRTPDAATLSDHYAARRHAPSLAAQAELRSLRKAENDLVADVPEIMVMEELPHPREAHLLRRGAYDAPGDVVARDTPAALPPFPADQPRNRLGLARWLTDRGNPLAARVAVIWRMHFGRGLVATPEDFGNQGRLPTHPELLDWLAARFMTSRWDVKALHRLIVTSAAFQRSSAAPADLVARDPDNELFARGPSRRLLAEEIRDAALASSGLLVRAVGGPSVKPYQPDGLWEEAGTGKTYRRDSGDKLYRRSLYTFWRRTLPPPSMLTFDAMSREVCTAKRDVTTTPLQALVLLNDPQFVEAARALAEHLLRRLPGDADARTREAFVALTGRRPDADETRILARLFDEQRQVFSKDDAAAARLLAVGESPRDAGLTRADAAAMTAVVSAIMNLDDFVAVR
jgi:hypothetical protein